MSAFSCWIDLLCMILDWREDGATSLLEGLWSVSMAVSCASVVTVTILPNQD